MKKFLALVLALVMTMSLVTISAGAEDFTDDSTITYGEAVDVMTAIGVVGGYADGSFNPTAGLTRGAAAKIICNMILGPTTAEALNADAAPFADVAVDNVFAGYIAYCVNEGIISGYADGTFRPAAPLTGYAFMKMLLGAIGYDATKEGYVGSNWSIAVAKQAISIGLDDGLVGEFAGTKALTREEACLYACNALTATMQKYENDSTISVGDIVIQNNSKAEDVTDNGGLGGTKHWFMEEYFSNLKVYDSSDAFGRPANYWVWKNAEVGTYAKTADTSWTEKVTEKMLYNAVGKNAYNNFTWFVYVDGAILNRAGTGTDADPYVYTRPTLDKTSTARYSVTGNGVLTEIFVDSSAMTVDVVMSKQYVGEISKIKTVADDDDTITVAVKGVGTKTYAIEDASDFAKEDIVIMTMASGAVKSMAKAETVEGKVSGFKTTEYAKMDGVTYNYNYSGNYNLETGSIGDPAANASAVLYLDAYGYVIGFEASETTADYLLVTAVETSFGDVKAKVTFVDGTSAVIDIDDVDGADATGAGAAAADYSGTYKAAGKVFEGAVYSYDKTDDVYDLTTLIVGTAEGKVAAGTGASIAKGTATFDSKVADTATKYIDVDNAKVYEGFKAVPSFSGVAYVMVYNDKGVADVVFLTAGTTATDDAEGYFIVKDEAYVYDETDDTKTWTYTVYVNGEETELVANKNLSLAADTMYEITKLDGDGYVDTVSPVIAAAQMAKAGLTVDCYATVAGNGTLDVVRAAGVTTVENTKTYLYDDATQFLTVTLKSTGAIDSVAAGSAADINVFASSAVAEDTGVYVIQVEDSTDTNPLAEIVLVVVPYVA